MEPTNIKEMLRIGLERLETSTRPNPELAAYFSTITERKDICPEIEDWATDAMVYAENDEDVPVPANLQNLKERFEKLPTS